MRYGFLMIALGLITASCGSQAQQQEAPNDLLSKYTTVRLTADLGDLSEGERQMIPILIEAADLMNEFFWEEAFGDVDRLMSTVEDPALRRFAEINYGPWDRLDGNSPFIEGYGPKPRGANFYPSDMTEEEFETAAATDPAFRSEYTMVRRDEAGALVAIPYNEYFGERMARAADLLDQAAELAEDQGLRRYLALRAEALRTDEYRESDRAWMDMKDNVLEVVIGPIEHYEDQLFGYKAAHETFILVKDLEWSERLSRYAALLPMLQEGLPVPEEYRQESPGTDSDLNAYDAIYYAGDANAGSKTIAINLPNDEQVQLEKGTRRLQLKNSMRAKFDEILLPIADVLIAEDQRDHITFDAFFDNTMFHEVAHGLGIKNTITGHGTVREALRDQYTTMEEGKADVLGLYMVTALDEAGEIDVDMMDHYATFLAGIFRSVRFGAASAHGRANMIRFNYFQEQGAFERDDVAGTYRVDPERMREAMNALSEDILRLQGDGDYEAVAAFVNRYGGMRQQLVDDLARIDRAGIPVDIVFQQGLSEIGL
ncbi:MAG: dipeptidyl-peptidase 3 family protein [Bacteroidota bacterium]